MLGTLEGLTFSEALGKERLRAEVLRGESGNSSVFLARPSLEARASQTGSEGLTFSEALGKERLRAEVLRGESGNSSVFLARPSLEARASQIPAFP